MRLTICGDLCVTPASLDFFKNADEKGAFTDTLDCIRDADRAIVNLETALTESENAIKKFGPNLKAPISTAETLKKAGFTDCNLSNNHVFDFGIEGLCDTVKALEEVGLLYNGIGENYEDSRKDHIIEQDGIRIAIVAVNEHEYTYATENRMGVRPFDEFETMHDIREAKKGADYVIVLYHGGKEFSHYPSPRLVKACREMVECGADAVFCQHSHCIGAYEKYEGSHILYGQGNFHFVGRQSTVDWNEGLILTLDIDKKGIDLDFVPIKAGNGAIRLANAEEREIMLSQLAERNAALADGSWRDRWVEFCESVKPAYRKAAGFSEDSTPEEYQFFAHYLDCEAHTDVWREIFKTWNHTNEVE